METHVDLPLLKMLNDLLIPALLSILVKPEMVRLQASEETVCRDAVVSFNCSANGNPSVFTFQLYENGVAVTNGGSSGMWSRTMSTGGVLNYTCMANNTIGTATSTSVSVTVNGKEFFHSENKWTFAPKSENIFLAVCLKIHPFSAFLYS